MVAALDGFFTIAVMILTGFVLAHFKVVDAGAQRTLSQIAFWVASPALLVTVLSRTAIGEVLGSGLVVATLGVAVTMAGYLVVSRVFGPRTLGTAVIGSLCAAYENAGNLGLPVAAYVLGNVGAVAPVLLLQLMVLTPIAMVLLDADARGERPRILTGIRSAVTNPITLAALTGLALSAGGITLPDPLQHPLAAIGGMAVPAMLIAFGISLRLGPKPGRGADLRDVLTLVVFKIVVHPAVAWGIAWAIGLRGPALFAAVVLAALPTAQNIFMYAMRYDRAVILARDAIFVSTLACMPVIMGIALAFHSG